ncbi:MAG: DNA mismatch repair protein MutS [Candidatus Dojkabacteria bacterium]
MQKQYLDIKKDYPNHILLFRLGDFYEAFNEDAEKLAKTIGITLTGRGKGEERYPMAGIPHHALANYLPKMIAAGLKVVIADQVEEATPGKLVERQVTKIITPGTVIDENSIDESKNNYISSLWFDQKKLNTTGEITVYISNADITTGEFLYFSVSGLTSLKSGLTSLKNEINKVRPVEVLCSISNFEVLKKALGNDFHFEVLESDFFNFETANKALIEHFGVSSLKGFGIKDNDLGIIPAGVLLNYLKQNQKTDLSHIKKLTQFDQSDLMNLDYGTIHNLELLSPMRFDGDVTATLYSVLDFAETAMGKRLLRNWIIRPLKNKDKLQERLDSTDYFFQKPALNDKIKHFLKNVYDIERIAGRIGALAANPKELVALGKSLKQVIELKDLLTADSFSLELPKRIKDLLASLDISYISKLADQIETALGDEPPTSIVDGNIFRSGYHPEIDALRELSSNSKKVLAEIQQREIQATGINSLKISYNKVFGYYIEVTKTRIDKIPEHYIRKQTLANAERYITEELKDLEQKILNAEESLISIERDLYLKLREEIAKEIFKVLNVSKAVAELDLYSCFGYVARQNKYVKPEIVYAQSPTSASQVREREIKKIELDKVEANTSLKNTELYIKIENGRHPVVEKLVENFIPNSTFFNPKEKIHILTGPNMSGKSTYIRQVALLVLLAQIGCFVPADKMEFSLVDRIFTRVGASDNLSKGESTFMVEMIETANILNNATSNSLIILDEVGRGTSTFDGVSIAWAIVEFIHEKLGSPTLFATHYHELIELEDQLEGICNYNVMVSEDDSDSNGDADGVIFTHKIVRGGTNKSYGVHVAKIAGLPKEVTDRASEILKKLENSKFDQTTKSIKTETKSKSPRSKQVPIDQLKLF